MAETAEGNKAGLRTNRPSSSTTSRWVSVGLLLACLALWFDKKRLTALDNTLFSNDDKSSSISSLPTIINTVFSSELPYALSPVTFLGCCGEGTNSWKQTCYTEKACNNSVFPFASAQEKALFEQWTPNEQEKEQRRDQCAVALNVTSPPVTWCQESDTMNLTHFPTGCSKVFGMGGRSGPFDRLYVFPQAKLAFCGIPKAGITRWLQFLRFTFGAKDYQSDPYFKRDVSLLRFDSFLHDRQMEILQDPSWTKAILIRDPAERLLSAYLDKIKGSRRWNVSMTFEEFVDFVASPDVSNELLKKAYSGLSWHTDPHWRPQAWSCGLAQLMPHFQYVGRLNRAAEHSKALLHRVGLWEPYGKHYRVSKEHTGERSRTMPPPALRPGERALGFQQTPEGNKSAALGTPHERDSGNRLAEYYTPELLDKVRKLYWMDFALWDALKQAESENKVNGRDIAAMLDSSCR